MTKLETLIVPEGIGVLLEDMDIGKSSRYFTMIDALFHYWDHTIGSPLGDFIAENRKELIEVILGTRGYEVEEEPLYYALIKGNELLDGVAKYWAHNKYDLEDLFISYETRDDSPIVVKNTKKHWNDLSINDSNADFVRVEE